MAALKWARLDKTFKAVGMTRSQAINEWADWALRDRPTSQLTRPPRVDLTADEVAAVEEAEHKRIHGQNGGVSSADD